MSPDKQSVITFTVNDIRNAMAALGISRPEQASLSNLVIDLTRQDRGIASRVSPYIYERGYDLLNTKQFESKKIAGMFRFVGMGKEAGSWLVWPETMPTLEIDSTSIPNIALRFIRRDEGALFSVIDYCDILSRVLSHHASHKVRVVRVQHPLKWQPNEIDGLYVGEEPLILYPVEAKALSTRDDINLSQMRGELETMRSNYGNVRICPIGCQMMRDGMRFAIFPILEQSQEIPFDLVPEAFLRVFLRPPVVAWMETRVRPKGAKGERIQSLDTFAVGNTTQTET